MSPKKSKHESKNIRQPTEEDLITFGRRAMFRYGAAIIERRALPDFRDGLKPVQRKILWSMHQNGINHKAIPVKLARTVGDVIAKYSPHGVASHLDTPSQRSTSIYLALPQ